MRTRSHVKGTFTQFLRPGPEFFPVKGVPSPQPSMADTGRSASLAPDAKMRLFAVPGNSKAPAIKGGGGGEILAYFQNGVLFILVSL